jgi:lipopolysaccharide transport system ATP-binding protein
MSDTVIQVENLGKQYRIGQRESYLTFRETIAKAVRTPFSRSKQPDDGLFWALKDVSFEVKRGEVLGIIGRNGAGKSTLLKILTRITEPTEGRATIHGRVASLLEVGTGFHPELTGRENIFLNGAILGMSKREIERKFDEIVAFSEIEKVLDTPVKHYSSGMYVRLAFAVAAHMESDILLIDEVLAVGDAEFRKKCLGKMQDVSHVGRTLLFVSHDMGNIANLSSRTVWLDSGRIRALGDTKSVISQYVSSGSHVGGEISWPDVESAPGNDMVRLKAVRIRSDGQVTADVLIDTEVRIEIDYWNFQDGAILVSNMHLWDKMNDLVLASANLPSASLSVDLWAERPRPKGLYRTVCVIPANFLNSENYSIGIGIQNGRLEWQAWEKNLLSFMVHETGEMKKEYMGSWGGVVRPKFSWSTVCLTSDDQN